MWRLWGSNHLFLILLQSILHLSVASSPPNIIFIVADDLGWNYVPWHNSNIISPRMKELVDNGVLLNNNYVQPLCSPSRAALLTGMYPFHTGRQQGVIDPQEPTGLSINYTLFPELLQDLGYTTHAIGKWHLGFCNWKYTPMRRGFDTFYGFYLGSGKYYEHTKQDTSGKWYFDFRDQESVAEEANGTYTTTLMTNRAIEIIHDQVGKEKPMFMYLPYQNVHSPYEVPDEYYNLYPEVSDHHTRHYMGGVTALDDSIGMIVDALKNAKIYKKTLIILTTDNGGPATVLDANIPLRGHKTSVWEGGTRGVAFMHSPLLENTPRTHNGLVHITDWYNTLLTVAGATELPENDGYNQWEVLRTGTDNPPREDFIYNLVDKGGVIKGAIRVGDMKFIMGETRDTDFEGPWLFNIADDPNETHNLIHEFPELVSEMEALLLAELPRMVPADKPEPSAAGVPEHGVWEPGWCHV